MSAVMSPEKQFLQRFLVGAVVFILLLRRERLAIESGMVKGTCINTQLAKDSDGTEALNH